MDQPQQTTADRQPGQCPTWCEVDHAERDRRFGDLADMPTHRATVLRLDNPFSSPRGTEVSVSVTDDMTEGVAGVPAVAVDRAEDLTPEQAEQVAAALVRAAQIAREAAPVNRCGRCGEPIERVGGTDPFWRHVGLIPDPPHGAAPA